MDDDVDEEHGEQEVAVGGAETVAGDGVELSESVGGIKI